VGDLERRKEGSMTQVLKCYGGNCGGRYFKTLPGGQDVSRAEIAEMVIHGEVVFIGRESEEQELLLTLKAIDGHFGDEKMLNRIIRGGGFVTYIEKLEAR
jgi:hypothetical protein